MKDNLEVLEQWKKQIKCFKSLSLKEAKQIYVNLKNTNDIEIRKQIRTELIQGTLNEVCKFIEKSGLLFLKNPLYDMEDIICSSCEAWIDIIDNKGLENTNSWAGLFNNHFYHKMGEKLGMTKHEIGFLTSFDIYEFNNILNWFILEKNSNKNISQDDFLNYLTKEIKSENITFRKYKISYTFELINSIYDVCFQENTQDVRIGKHKLQLLQYLLVDCGLANCDDQVCIIDEDPFNKVWEENIPETLKRIVFDTNILNKREKQVIAERYGFDEKKAKSLEEIALLEGMPTSRERIRQIEAKSLRKLRASKKIQNCY